MSSGKRNIKKVRCAKYLSVAMCIGRVKVGFYNIIFQYKDTELTLSSLTISLWCAEVLDL